MSKTVNAKINDYSAELLYRLCRRKGLIVNNLIKLCVEVLIRYMSDKHNLTPDMEQMMSIFEHTEGWKNAFSLCDVDGETEIAAAIYFVQSAEGKTGIRPVWVEKPFFGNWTQDINPVTILEKFITLATPDLSKRLRGLAVEIGCKTMFETIFTLCAMYGKDAYEQMFREEFSDCNRSEFGLRPHEGTPFRRKMHKEVDSQEGLDFRPFDQEY